MGLEPGRDLAISVRRSNQVNSCVPVKGSFRSGSCVPVKVKNMSDVHEMNHMNSGNEIK